MSAEAILALKLLIPWAFVMGFFIREYRSVSRDLREIEAQRAAQDPQQRRS